MSTGAPETYAPSAYTEFHKNNVKKSIDIWSLGAVYSEIVVWTVRGWRGVVDFRTRRKEVISRINGFRISDCFHDGQQPLEVVTRLDENLEPQCPHSCNARQDSTDHSAVRRLMSTVIDSMILEMLNKNPDSRPTAAQLDSKAEAILRRAEVFDKQRKEAERTAAAQPITASAYSSAGFLDQSDVHVLTLSPDEISSRRENQGAGIRPTSAPRVRACGAGRTSPLQAPPRNSDSPSLPSSTPRLFSAPLRDSLTSTRRPNRTSSLNIPRPWHTSSSSFSADMRLSMDDWNATRQSWGIQESSREGAIAERISRISSDHASDPQPDLLSSEFASHDLHQRSEPSGHFNRPEHLSVDEVKSWYKTRKEDDKNARLKDDYLLSYLEDRDHVFIIDDAESMDAHWQEVKELAKLLIYITKTADKDGIDVYFLSSTRSRNYTRSSEAAANIGRQRRAGKTSIDAVIHQEAHKYCRRTDAYLKRSAILPRAPPPKKRSLYVFTNGKLEHGGQNQGHDSIEMLVNKLVGASLSRMQFGIQFIRFGHDSAGSARLNALDRLNQIRDLKLNIVDAEPSDGNVWKMFQGAINERFDDDIPVSDTATAPDRTRLKA